MLLRRRLGVRRSVRRRISLRAVSRRRITRGGISRRRISVLRISLRRIACSVQKIRIIATKQSEKQTLDLKEEKKNPDREKRNAYLEEEGRRRVAVAGCNSSLSLFASIDRLLEFFHCLEFFLNAIEFFFWVWFVIRWFFKQREMREKGVQTRDVI